MSDRYLIIVQPTKHVRGFVQGDHWLSSGSVAQAERFAKWVHRATDAAVNVYDVQREQSRLTLGDFDESRT